MNVNEIKSWAKSRGFTVKKSDEGYVWFGDGVEAAEAASIEDVALAIFNKVTDNKFVEYQRDRREKA